MHTAIDSTTPLTVSIKAGKWECHFIVAASFMHDITELLSLTFDKSALQKFEDDIQCTLFFLFLFFNENHL